MGWSGNEERRHYDGPMTDEPRGSDAAPPVGPNDWLVDDMYRQFLQDPSSVSESWREFFEDYKPRRGPQAGAGNGQRGVRGAAERSETGVRSTPVPRSEGEEAEATTDVREAPPPLPDGQKPKAPEDATPLRGPAAAIVKNMETSLTVPTATSVRTIPAKLIEENRRVINEYLSRGRGGKVSFTHIIGWAIVRALGKVPALNSSYVEIDGVPHVVRHKGVHLGLAVDMQRKDGSRTLLVPNIKDANSLDFAGFHAAYEDVIRKVRAGKIDRKSVV
jgi:2-oxoglutarate decarboxylase